MFGNFGLWANRKSWRATRNNALHRGRESSRTLPGCLKRFVPYHALNFTGRGWRDAE